MQMRQSMPVQIQTEALLKIEVCDFEQVGMRSQIINS